MIDYARRRRAKKRGGEFHITSSGADVASTEECPSDELEQLGTALDTLAGADPGLVQLVDLHFFCGFSFGEVAERASGISGIG